MHRGSQGDGHGSGDTDAFIPRGRDRAGSLLRRADVREATGAETRDPLPIADDALTLSLPRAGLGAGAVPVGYDKRPPMPTSIPASLTSLRSPAIASNWRETKEQTRRNASATDETSEKTRAGCRDTRESGFGTL